MKRTLILTAAVAALFALGGCKTADTMSHATPKNPPTPAPTAPTTSAPVPISSAVKPLDKPAPKPAAETPADKPAADKAGADATPAKPSPEELARRRAEADKKRREELAARYPADAAEWVDSFSGDATEWRVMDWGNAAVAQLVTQDGDQRLRVAASSGKKDKIAILKPLRMDLSSRGTVLVDMTNGTGETVGVAVSITTDEWYESPIQQAQPGLTEGMRFDLTGKDFKTKTTDWKYAAAIKQKDRPQYITILIYTNNPGIFFIDNVRLVK